ncbi:1d84e5eb-d980-4e40-a23f-e46109519c61 [Thermothielavioides terrestris]|uniref:1d84e5eb-d980-4e40-a23f-e46109519c61 n=1 Tax=Thermothielavioides terrestris TaxID=2587410 RepID=A0A3S4BB92_9PEZI|nr:1d84e5eb-d980-4e40-a23f-e46109519c61 [Thermothielavioides terrestris]
MSRFLQRALEQQTKDSKPLASTPATQAAESSLPPPFHSYDPGPQNTKDVAFEFDIDKWDAEEYIRQFIADLADEHPAYYSTVSVRASCHLSLSRLHALGSLPQRDGCRACGELFRAPVIHAQVGAALWEKLAAEVRRGSDSALFRRLHNNNSSSSSGTAYSDKQGGDTTPAPTPTPTCPPCPSPCSCTPGGITVKLAWNKAKQAAQRLLLPRPRKQARPLHRPKHRRGSGCSSTSTGTNNNNNSRDARTRTATSYHHPQITGCAICSGTCPAVAAAAAAAASQRNRLLACDG